MQVARNNASYLSARRELAVGRLKMGCRSGHLILSIKPQDNPLADAQCPDSIIRDNTAIRRVGSRRSIHSGLLHEMVPYSGAIPVRYEKMTPGTLYVVG
jgi:hypothetical protein